MSSSQNPSLIEEGATATPNPYLPSNLSLVCILASNNSGGVPPLPSSVHIKGVPATGASLGEGLGCVAVLRFRCLDIWHDSPTYLPLGGGGGGPVGGGGPTG